jgi:hypothetical protein
MGSSTMAFYLTEDQRLWVIRQADAAGKSYSWVIRKLIRDAQRDADEA